MSSDQRCKCGKFVLMHHKDYGLLPYMDQAMNEEHRTDICGHWLDLREHDRAAKGEGRKDDVGKEPWDLFPWVPAREIVRVLGHGAKKYAPHNWKKVPNPRERYYAAMLRHITAWWDGERYDQESKLHHLAHAGCCLLFLMWFDQNQDVP